MGEQDPMRRFIPYVQMHEFEALLLFSDPVVSWQIATKKAGFWQSDFWAIRNDFRYTGAHIDDSPVTRAEQSEYLQNLFPRISRKFKWAKQRQL